MLIDTFHVIYMEELPSTVKAYKDEEIKDMVELYSNSMSGYTDVYIDNFVDQWYGMCVDNCLMEETVKRSFYNDNAFVRREEERLL